MSKQSLDKLGMKNFGMLCCAKLLLDVGHNSLHRLRSQR